MLKPSISIRRSRAAALLLLALVAAGCQRADKDKNKDKGKDQLAAAGADDPQSQDILARAPVATNVEIKHVLLGWKDLAGVYGDRFDKRAAARTKAEAAALALKVAAQLR